MLDGWWRLEADDSAFRGRAVLLRAHALKTPGQRRPRNPEKLRGASLVLASLLIARVLPRSAPTPISERRSTAALVRCGAAQPFRGGRPRPFIAVG